MRESVSRSESDIEKKSGLRERKINFSEVSLVTCYEVECLSLCAFYTNSVLGGLVFMELSALTGFGSGRGR